MRALTLTVLASVMLAQQAFALDLEQAAKDKEQQLNTAEDKVKGSFTEEIKKMMASLGEIEAVRMIPIKGVMLIQLKDKPPIFVSSNGRFLITGEIKDLWNKEPVKTLKQADDAWLLHLDDFIGGNLLKQFAVIPYGNQSLPKQARIFVSPTAPESQKLVKELEPKKVNVDLIIFPHEKGAITAAMRTWCAYSTPDAIQALITGKFDDVPQRTCNEDDLKQVMGPMLMANYLDIDRVPYFVRLDGHRFSGMPKDVQGWLENKPEATPTPTTKPAEKATASQPAKPNDAVKTTASNSEPSPIDSTSRELSGAAIGRK